MAIGIIHPAAGGPRRHGLYLSAALVSIALVGWGFAHSFYLRAWVPSAPPMTALAWAHGLAMSAWLALFLVQARLAATRNLATHRRLGVVGAILMPAMLVIGVMTTQEAGHRGFSPAAEVTPLAFMAVPLVSIALFAVLVGLALWWRRRPDVHKRLMLLATLSILTPGIARIPVAPFHDAGLPAFFGFNLLLVCAWIAVDTIQHRRLHPAFGWGGAAVIASVPARILMANTAWWTAFAGWLAS